MEGMETTDILGNQVEVRMVTKRIKEWGAILIGRKEAIPRMVGECQNHIGLWQIRILECGRRGASYVHVS